MSVYNQSRSRVIQIIFAVVFLIIIGQLLNLQVFSSKYSKLAEDNAIFKKIIYPSRGIIFDRHSKAILDNVAMFDLTVTPFQVKNIDTATLCRIMDIDTTEFRKRMLTAVNKNGKFRPSIFEGLIAPQMQAQLEENMYRFAGFDLTERPIRTYPYQAAAHILGYVGEADSAAIKKSKGFYQLGDYIGKTGLEASYERVLMGQRGIKFQLRDNKNRIQGTYENGLYDTAALAGRNLYTSIDIEMQQLADKLMKNKLGGVVAINVKTGGILAMASGPSFDPNELTGPDRRKNFNRMFRDTATPLLNRAIAGQYPPGSTFKPLGGLVALDEGVITAQYGYPCGGAYYSCGGKKAPKCTHSGGGHASSLRVALANSCNSYFIDVFRKALDNKAYGNPNAGYIKWKEYMNGFGLGTKLGVDIPGEIKASIPDTAKYNRDFGGFARWNSCNLLTLGIGQDRMTATPLQMANAMCIIANKGFYYTPHFVDSLQNETASDTIMAKYRKKHTPLHIPDSMYTYVIEGMHDVTQFGTATRIFVPGVQFCAKTGTAQNPHGKNHSWFVAFAPKDDPKIAVAVIVENAGYGATWGGPISAFMMEKYLNDTLSNSSKIRLEEVAKADLIPTAMKQWYYRKDSARRAAQIEEDAQILLNSVERKVTYDPEAEPNRNDSEDSSGTIHKSPMLLPDNKKNRKDTAKN